MTETATSESNGSIVISEETQLIRTHAIICYVLMLLTPFSYGFTELVAIVWAYIKWGDASSNVLKDHFRNIIRVFWFGLLYACLAGGVLVLGGSFLFVVAIFGIGIWTYYRMIKGLVRVMDRKTYYKN